MYFTHFIVTEWLFIKEFPGLDLLIKVTSSLSWENRGVIQNFQFLLLRSICGRFLCIGFDFHIIHLVPHFYSCWGPYIHFNVFRVQRLFICLINVVNSLDRNWNPISFIWNSTVPLSCNLYLKWYLSYS